MRGEFLQRGRSGTRWKDKEKFRRKKTHVFESLFLALKPTNYIYIYKNDKKLYYIKDPGLYETVEYMAFNW